ncbi:MAG TPA: hypothetical protein VET88_02000 [Gammaproteobacteria bacterium]|nr:hypothetical protein [Gammaproteobacteria bacterium]
MEMLSARPAQLAQLAQLCSTADAEAGLDVLADKLRAVLPGTDIRPVLTRCGWHRLGGVVDAAYRPVSDNIVQWAEQESGGDVDELVCRYLDAGYFATRLAGKTHYFTYPCGDGAEDFVQLEVEELQEVLDRPLLDRDWSPDSLEDFLDPLDYPRLEPEPLGKPCYVFRSMTSIADHLGDAADTSREIANLQRFARDWSLSSASEGEPFCRHWVLALRKYMDSDGECRFTARPLSTFSGELPVLPPGSSLQGAELARAIHAYDRSLGYPFAWYFIMLSRKAANYALAEAVLRDQMGAYDYLPARDLRVLRDWEARPYGV